MSEIKLRMSSGARIGVNLTGKINVNDYTLTILPIDGGYTLTAERGGHTQSMNVYSMTEEQMSAIIAAEHGRADAEQMRVIAELARVNAEAQRESATSQAVANANAAAAEIRAAAERGDFNGRDGVDGKDGKDGENGKDGAPGRDGIDAQPYDDTEIRGEIADHETRIDYLEKHGGGSTKELEEKIEAVQDNLTRKERHTNARELLNVAYSHIYLAPANTMEHFLTAARLNFNALKCDCRLTSDGGIILCHDAGYTLNSNGRITTYSAGNATAIHDMTVAQCKALEFETIYYLNDHYAHPCELKDFLSVCKEYKKIPFITLRDSYTEETASVILAELDKFGLRDVAIINSIKPITNLEIMRSLDKHIAMNFVIDHGETLTNAYVDAVNALGNCSVSMFSLPADTTGTVYDASIPAVRYAQSLGLTVQNAQITNYSDYRKMVDDGFSGLQLTRAILPMPISTVPFKITVSVGVGTISGMFKWTVPYTADISVSSDGVTVRNITESGSQRGFADGLMPLWMNQLPYTIDVVSESGRNCSAKWRDNAIVIDTDNANDVYDVCVTFGNVDPKESTVPVPTDDEYRLVSEFTADGTNSLIVRNLALKNVLVHIHSTAASAAGNVTVAMTTNTNVELQGYVSNAINTADRYCMVKADREHGRFFVTQTAAGATNGVAAVSTRVNTLDGNVAAEFIRTVSIAKVFPEGSTIKIYGIDA